MSWTLTLKKWDSSRNIKRDEIYRGISVTRKQQLLARIAAEFFERKEIYFAEKDIVKIIDEYLKTLPGFQDDIDGETFLKAIEAQHGLLVERAHRIHSFSHLTFQEYFVARYIIENGSDKILLRLMSHLSDKYWHEVFLIVASLLPHADNFFDAMASALQDIRGYSFPIRLSRMLSVLKAFTPPKRLVFFYVSSAFELVIHKDLARIQGLADDISLNEGLDELLNIERKASQIADAVLSLRNDVNEQLVPYDLLEALDPIGLALSYFIDTRIIPPEKYTMGKIISIVDDINMRTRTHLDKIQGVAQDLASVAYRIRGGGHGKIKRRKADDYSKLKNLYADLSKKIDATINLINKADEMMGIPFSTKGAEWVFTEDEIGELLNYLYIQRLLLECLRSASVSDRKKTIVKTFLQ